MSRFPRRHSAFSVALSGCRATAASRSPRPRQLIRQRDRLIGIGEPIQGKYERITFEKSLRAVPGQPLATFVCPGQPLLASTIDLILERNRDLLKRGTVLVDPDDSGETVRTLFYLEHTIQDGRTDKAGNRGVVSRQLQFVETDSSGVTRNAGYTPTSAT